MLGKLIGWDDTIVALATPPGMGAIGVIRISGKKTFEIADQLFPSKKISQQLSHTLHVGHLKEDGKVIDEAVLALYKSPRSYTGEDVIEIRDFLSRFTIHPCKNHTGNPAFRSEISKARRIHATSISQWQA
jgi:tRNA modification GTPase